MELLSDLVATSTKLSVVACRNPAATESLGPTGGR
jgi:hypothetical protein